MRKFANFWVSPAEAVFFVSAALFVIGTVNIFSASFVLGAELFNDSYFFVKRHLVSFGIGLVAMLFLAKIDYRRTRGAFSLAILLISIGLLVAVLLYGIELNGAKRWIQLGAIRFQPSEICKIALIMTVASYLGNRLDCGQPISLKSWPAAAMFLIGFLVMKQPDMGTAVIIVGLGITLYLLAGISYKEMGILAISCSSLTIYLISKAAYRAERILAWRDPWAYQQTSGYQTVQSLLAIGSGGAFGTGLGKGVSKFHYLPESHTDFAFAILCQEMGFLGVFVIFALLILFSWYGFKIAFKAPDRYGTMLALGLTVLIVGQSIGNIAMVTGLAPVTGIPLPFLSFGGTSLIVNMAAIGLLLSVGRQGVEKISQEDNIRESKKHFANARSHLRLAKKNGSA